MIQNVLREVGGVGIYGVVSICLFFAVFTGALIWALAQKRTTLRAVSRLPLREDNEKGPTR